LSEDYINNGVNDDIFKEQKTTNKQATKYSQTKQKHKIKEKKRKKTKRELILVSKRRRTGYKIMSL
jgi:hypothetical protein